MTKLLEPHPLSEIFPDIPKKALIELEDDILQNGVHEPIWIYEGKILDGRHRYKAAMRTGTRCPTREYEGSNPFAFVWSMNGPRRHLSESQKMMIGAKLAALSIGSNQHTPNGVPSSAAAAALLNVSERSITRAKNVINKAVPEVIKAVENGAVSVSLASKVADKPKDEQKEIIKGSKKEIIAAVNPQEEAEPAYTEMDALHDQVAALQDMLAAGVMALTEEEKGSAEEYISGLRAEIKTLKASLAAVTTSRDTLMAERAQMMRQISMLQKKLKAAENK